MASTIKLKNGSGAPTTGDLVQGEPALDLTNKRLYTENASGVVIEVGTNPSTIDINAGTIDGTVIGGTTPAAVTTSSLVATTADINAGTIDGTVIGGSTAAAGTFTTGAFSGDTTIGAATAATNVQLTLNGVANKAKRIKFAESGVDKWIIGQGAASETDAFEIYNTNGQMSLSIAKATSAAAFSGNVGIGTSSPSNTLDLRKDTPAFSQTSSSGAYYTTLGTNVDYTKSFVLNNKGSEIITYGDDTGYGLNLNGGASNLIRFTTNATERVRIDSSGNVGIGKTPNTNFGGYVLQLNGGSQTFMSFGNSTTGTTLTDGLVIGCDSAGADIYQREAQPLRFHTSNTERMRIDASGNVGIGNSNPTDKLHLGTNSGGTQLKIQSGSGVNNCVLYTNGTTDSWRTGMNLALTNGSYEFYDDINNVSRMVIDSSGSVGIGTSSPTGAKLQVVAESGSNVLGVGTTTQGLFIKTTGTTVDYNSSGNSAGEHTFSTGNTERMRLNASGNLLVGTTDTVIWNDTSGEGVVIGPNAIQVARASDVCLLLNRQSTDGVVQAFASRGVQVGDITVSVSSTAYNTSSDQRLKENITDANDAGDKIDAIKVRQYDWKADGSHQDYGMVAQELMTVAPEAVSVPEDPEKMMGVDYSKLVPMMLKEIQSLRARVAQLEGAN
jgi:hypothetical protein